MNVKAIAYTCARRAARVRHGRSVGRAHSVQRRRPGRSAHAHLQPAGRSQARRLGAVVGELDRIVDDVLDVRRRHRHRGGRRTASGLRLGAGALEAGKSVVTANKQLMAHHGTELLELARVARARSPVRGLGRRRHSRAAGAAGRAGRRSPRRSARHSERHLRLHPQPHAVGGQLSFADALTEAQTAGYAEADPSEDVDGADAAAKLAIIAAVGLRRPVRVGDIATQIDPADRVGRLRVRARARAARSARSRARRSRTTARVFAAVRPALVPRRSNFGRVEGSQNLVTVRGVFGGETSFSGSGAGGSPTAVAVVSDVLSVRRAPVTSRVAAPRRRRPRCDAATSSRRTTCGSRSTTSPASWRR